MTVTSAGSYPFPYTALFRSCSASASVSVAQNIAVPVLSIAPPADLTCTVTSVTLTAASSTPADAYNWGAYITTVTTTVTSEGTYSVTVTDPANGCSASASVS